MGTENPIRTLGDYSKPSHEGYKNTIELPVGMNVTNHRPSVSGKLRNKNAKESWTLLEDLALYDNKSWSNIRDFAKPVKAISSPQDVPMNKITSSCEICSVSHDTQYCMENPEQAFVDYASLCTNEARELVSNFMASQDARLSKFKADFKQQQCEMTNKIDTILKAITDRMAEALSSETVKNPKLNVNSTSPVLSTRFYPTIDPQCSSHPSTSINAVKTSSKEASHSQTSQLQTWMGIGTQQIGEPKQTLEDEF
ncbi:hypothetical protein Tco_0003047 [Tanacetum coccineum]